MWSHNSVAIVLDTRLSGGCDLIVADAAARQVRSWTAPALHIVAYTAKCAASHPYLFETLSLLIDHWQHGGRVQRRRSAHYVPRGSGGCYHCLGHVTDVRPSQAAIYEKSWCVLVLCLLVRAASFANTGVV